MKEALMIRHTVKRVGSQLEQLAERGVTMTRAFDILVAKSRSIEEVVVIEVMREVHQEMIAREEAAAERQADSSTRSARMPSMALSR